jgi:hypothetical protein
MLDDTYFDEAPATQLWLKGAVTMLYPHELTRMLDFVRMAAGSALSLDPGVDLPMLPKADLLALAVRAQRAELDSGIVGSLLVLASHRGSSVAEAGLVHLVGQRCASARFGGDRSPAGIAERRMLRRTFRILQSRLDRFELLEKFDHFLAEFVAAGEAVTLGDAWAEFRRSGTDGATHRILAPKLKSVRHLEEGGEAFRLLSGPLPTWRSPVSVAVLAAALAIEFPHLAGIVGEVAAFVAGGSAETQRPILLVGPPAIGKDSLLRRAAELVGRPHGEYDLAGSNDNRILRGTSKGWSSASPSHPVSVCAQARCANPLIQYSELDRAGGSRRNGVVHESLLGLCEPSTRRVWFDDGLGTPVDLTDVAFAFTANGTADTPGPLLTRLRVLQLERPKPEHVRPILEQVRRRHAAASQVRIEDLPEVLPEVVGRLEAVARQGRFNLRLADRIVRSLCREPVDRPRN